MNSVEQRFVEHLLVFIVDLHADARLRHEALVEYLARQGQLDRERFRAFRDGYVRQRRKDVALEASRTLQTQMNAFRAEIDEAGLLHGRPDL